VTAKGYTTKALVAAELGVTFSGAQDGQCDGLIEEVEDFIDHETGRSWIVASPVTEVLTVPDSGVLYLTNRPVTAITSVSVRSASIGAAASLLVAGTTYELLSAAEGVLLVSTEPDYVATVIYTHTNAAAVLPGDIQRAATLLVAAWMARRVLSPGTAGLDSLSLGSGEIALKFSKPDDVIADAMRHIRGRERVVFA
jgi:hypothetical protein